MAMINEGVRLKGILDIYDQDGRLLQHVENLITDAGLAALAALICSGSTRAGWVAVGTGTTVPANGDTALETETARVATDAPVVYASVYARWIATIPSGTANVHLYEAGLLDAASVGVLWSHVAIDVNKTSSMTLTFDWKWLAARG
jgi:hypothetical protein